MSKRRAIQSGKATQIPAGFKQVSVKTPGSKKAHTYVECCGVIQTNHDRYPCAYSIRKDRLPKNVPIEIALQHKCFNETLDQYFSKKENEENRIAGPGDRIEEKLIYLTGRYSLSIETAVSSVMRNLLLTAIKIGQQNPAEDPELLLPVFNRRSFTKDMIKKGKEMYEMYKQKYLQYNLISLNVDGGKI